jgi:hypothetical protein
VRTLLRVTLTDTEAANAALHEGRLQKMIKSNIESLKAEAAYFLPDGGYRTAMIVFDMKDASDIARIGEPFFTELNASVEFLPVMTAEDLMRGLQQ